ncbi:MAG: hypothetical protein LC789_05930 [Actinobacteria bacterium]|nr:hypothetical protein [Actinomycetota bacterium]MCA1719940.1 hypothetical protein [Actinomycetota bacterium]
MTIRTAAVLALCVSVVGGGAAVAAPKAKPKPVPVCNLVADDKGDATGGVVSPGNVPAWDVTSADIATDAKTLTSVIRVDKLAKSVNDSPLGSQWRMDFFVGEKHLYTQATSTPFGDKFIFGYTDTTSHRVADAGATGVFDLDLNEVRVSVPLSGIESQAKITPGTKLTQLSAQAGDYINTAGGSPSLSNAADEAEGAKPYAAATPSCVAVGK